MAEKFQVSMINSFWIRTYIITIIVIKKIIIKFKYTNGKPELQLGEVSFFKKIITIKR